MPSVELSLCPGFESPSGSVNGWQKAPCPEELVSLTPWSHLSSGKSKVPAKHGSLLVKLLLPGKWVKESVVLEGFGYHRKGSLYWLTSSLGTYLNSMCACMCVHSLTCGTHTRGRRFAGLVFPQIGSEVSWWVSHAIITNDYIQHRMSQSSLPDPGQADPEPGSLSFSTKQRELLIVRSLPPTWSSHAVFHAKPAGPGNDCVAHLTLSNEREIPLTFEPRL